MHSLLQFCQQNKIENILLSNEDWLLSKNTTHIFGEFLNKTPNVKNVIIAYLRRIDTWIGSGWKKWRLKVHNSIEEHANMPFVKHKYKRTLEHLQEWETLIGKGILIIRPSEKSQLPGGLIKDFLDQIGIKYVDRTWNQTEDANLAKIYGFNRDVLEILHAC